MSASILRNFEIKTCVPNLGSQEELTQIVFDKSGGKQRKGE